MASKHWIEKVLTDDLAQWRRVQRLSAEERNRLMKRDGILFQASFGQRIKWLQYGIWMIVLLLLIDAICRAVIGADWWIPIIYLAGELLFAFLVYLIACLR